MGVFWAEVVSHEESNQEAGCHVCSNHLMKNNCDVLLTEDEGSLTVLTELLTDNLST